MHVPGGVAGFQSLVLLVYSTRSLSVVQIVYQLSCVLHARLLLQQLFAVVPFAWGFQSTWQITTDCF